MKLNQIHDVKGPGIDVFQEAGSIKTLINMRNGENKLGNKNILPNVT